MKKIKLGICEWVSPVPGPSVCRVAAEVGLDGVELNIGSCERGLPLSNATIQRYYRDEAERWGISFSSMALNGLTPHTLLHPEDRAEDEIVRDILRRSVKAAAALSIPLIQVPSFYDGGMDSPESMKATAHYLRYLCDLAAEHDIRIGSENTLTAEENLALVNMVNRPNFCIYFDIENAVFFRSENPAEAIRRLGKAICEIHMKDGTRKALASRPLGEGHACFEECARTIRDIDYSGWLILENNYDRTPLRSVAAEDFGQLKQDVHQLKEAFCQ